MIKISNTNFTEQYNRVKDNINAAYNAIAAKKGTVPAIKNSANLTEAINSIGGGGEGIAPDDISSLIVVAKDTKVALKWADPQDTIVDGETIVQWKGTILTYKIGSYPQNPNDGVKVLDNTTRNQYQTNPYEVTGLTNNTKYYFRLFPYSTEDIVNLDGENAFVSTPVEIAPGNCSSIAAKAANGQVTITWSDPNNIVENGITKCAWAGTQLRYNTGTYPTKTTGTLAIDSKVRNQYASSGYTVTGLTNGTVYYFQLFPYSDVGTYNTNTANRTSATPVAFKIMTAIIDESNSNSLTCVSYANDAVGMTKGSAAWDEFFGMKPCLMENGVVTKYLNPNDFTKDVDGNTVSLTTIGTDVMIEFPRRGLKISKSGTQIKVSMTDNPNDSNFDYYAHKRGSTQKNYFYLGAYLAYNSSSKLYSVSGQMPASGVSLANFISYANARGTGYEIMAAFQVYFIQAMYILKYGNLNSQAALGKGYTSSSSNTSTGTTNSNGMCYGSTSSGTVHVKLFGLEDFWGNLYQYLSGIASNSSFNLLLTTNNFASLTRSSGQEYTYTTGVSNYTYGYMNKSQGTSLGGFTMVPTGNNGSGSTYYADYACLQASGFADFGGYCNSYDGVYAGAFSFRVGYYGGSADSSVGCRLMYL